MSAAPLTDERMIPHRVAPVCDQHGDKGGYRSICPYCALEKLAAALSEIDYLCGEPNEMRVSWYDVFCNEDAVVERVRKLIKPPRYLVYPIDKHQSCPYFTDTPGEHGEMDSFDVLVDLERGERRFNGAWLEIESVKRK